MVQDARIANFTYGVQIAGGAGVAISNSSIWRNQIGIWVSGTTNAKVSGNRLFNNTTDGIRSDGSSGTYTGNNSSSNGNFTNGPSYQNTDGTGFQITGSNNLFANNNATGNFWFGMKIIGSSFTASSNNTFRNNIISMNGNATGGGGLVLIDNASANLIIGNNITKEVNALGLEWQSYSALDSYNNITMNRITANLQGIYINGSYNVIYNNYLSNISNAVDNSYASIRNASNSWNITKALRTNILGGPFQAGNFYSDYSGSDSDGDGIGDTPYSTSTRPSLDLLPLTPSQPSVVHDIAVRSIASLSNPPRAGASVSLSVSVFNQGSIPESFKFNTSPLHSYRHGRHSNPARLVRHHRNDNLEYDERQTRRLHADGKREFGAGRLKHNEQHFSSSHVEPIT